MIEEFDELVVDLSCIAVTSVEGCKFCAIATAFRDTPTHNEKADLQTGSRQLQTKVWPKLSSQYSITIDNRKWTLL